MTLFAARAWIESRVTVQEAVTFYVLTLGAFGLGLAKGWWG